MFECKPCNFKTDKKINHERHIGTKKHLIKSAGICINCCKQITDVDEHHKKNCELVGELEKKLKEQQDIIREYDIFKKVMVEKEDKIKHYEHEIKYLESLVVSAGGVIKQSMSTIKYLSIHHKDTPVIKGVENSRKLLEDNTDKPLIDDIFYYFDKKRLDEYIGQQIVDYYTTEDPKLQPIWTTDTTRLTYSLKQIENDWTLDKKGIITQEKIIDPILHDLKIFLQEYCKKNKKEIKKFSTEKAQDMTIKFRICTLVITDIDNGRLSNDILRYMAPKLFFNKKLIK